MTRNIVPDLIIVGILLGTFLFTYFLVNIFYGFLVDDENEGKKLSFSQIVDSISKEYSWLVKLTINSIGYSAVLLPGILIYKYTKKTKYLERNEPNFIYYCVRVCFAEHDRSDSTSQNSSTRADKRAVAKECILLCWCFVGLMISFLTWGVLQEKIMTREYVGLDGETKAYFKDSQFLVFANRFLALFIALGYLSFMRKSNKQRAPLFKFSFASISNIISAWMQYEALKYISFPTQVLAKSCKIIPVMIMGKIISRNKYEFYEYIVAIMISIGMIFFLSGSYNHGKHSPVTTFTGLFLLCMYMACDSFTSNWQSQIFQTYSIKPIQMMAGINIFSSLFTAASLFVQNGFGEGIAFSAEHPKFLIDCVVLSISSAVGQLFIYFTIEKFGAIVFTIIMTLRQAVAILLSCLIYDHDISPMGVLGIFIVFMGISVRVYSSHRLKTMRKRHELLRKQLKLNA